MKALTFNNFRIGSFRHLQNQIDNKMLKSSVWATSMIMKITTLQEERLFQYSLPRWIWLLQ